MAVPAIFRVSGDLSHPYPHGVVGPGSDQHG
jgi:hypothetical protein